MIRCDDDDDDDDDDFDDDDDDNDYSNHSFLYKNYLSVGLSRAYMYVCAHVHQTPPKLYVRF